MIISLSSSLGIQFLIFHYLWFFMPSLSLWVRCVAFYHSNCLLPFLAGLWAVIQIEEFRKQDPRVTFVRWPSTLVLVYLLFSSVGRERIVCCDTSHQSRNGVMVVCYDWWQALPSNHSSYHWVSLLSLCLCLSLSSLCLLIFNFFLF